MLKVAVGIILPQSESNNEIAKFRDHIQQGIEEKLLTIGDIEIVDKTEKKWVYYIEVTFSLCKSSENPSESTARISAQIINDKGWVDANYDSVFAYPIDHLLSVYIGFVSLFNDTCLQQVRDLDKHLKE